MSHSGLGRSAPLSLDRANFISTGTAAKIAGVNRDTILQWIADNTIRSFRTIGGHYRIDKTHLLSLINGTNPKHCGKKVIIYARVSQVSQKSHLKNQVDTLKKYCAKNYPNLPITVFQECGSGFNEQRKAIDQMLNEIMSGNYRDGILVCSYRDRLSRFACGFIEKICQFHGMEIVYTEQEGTTDEEMAKSDLLSFLNYWMSRSYGSRQKSKAKKLTEECIKRGMELIKSGIAVNTIVPILQSEGFQDVTSHTVRRYIFNQKELLGPIVDIKSSAEEYKAIFVKNESYQHRTFSAELYDDYIKWANANGKIVLTKPMFSRHFAEYKLISYTKDRGNTRHTYAGFTIKGKPELSIVVAERKKQEKGGQIDELFNWIKGLKGKTISKRNVLSDYGQYCEENQLAPMGDTEVLAGVENLAISKQLNGSTVNYQF